MEKLTNPFTSLEGYNCFGCAPGNPAGVKMTFYEDGTDIVSHWQPTPAYQGWLHTLHGGIQSVLLDEICGWAVMRRMQTAGVTSRMETRYLRPVATDAGPVILRARIRETRRNIALVEATLTDATGRVCTEALCTYFTFPPERARRDMHFRACLTESEAAAGSSPAGTADAR